MTLLAWLVTAARTLGAFVAEIAAAVLPELARQWRRPRETQLHGADPEVQDDIDASIDEQATRALGGSRIGPQNTASAITPTGPAARP